MFQTIILCNFQETNELNLKLTKNQMLGPILGRLVQIWAPNFFLSFTSTSNYTLFQAIILSNWKDD